VIKTYINDNIFTMNNKPKLTVSGYRGIWGDSLNEKIVNDYTSAFIKFVEDNINKNPTILIGRDGRESGPIIREKIIEVFKNKKINFVDGDILPTPTILFAVRKHKYDGCHYQNKYSVLK